MLSLTKNHCFAAHAIRTVLLHAQKKRKSRSGLARIVQQVNLGADFRYFSVDGSHWTNIAPLDFLYTMEVL